MAQNEREFEIPPEIIALHKRMDAVERPLVTALGDAIGYGRLMQLAEDIWKHKEAGRGGELTVGPCGAFMVPCEHWIKDDMGHCELCCGAGRVTKGVAALATVPQQDHAVVDALNAARNFIINGMEYGFIRMPEMQSDPAHTVLPMIDKALTALQPEHQGER